MSHSFAEGTMGELAERRSLLQEPEELMEQHNMQHVQDLLRKTPVCR